MSIPMSAAPTTKPMRQKRILVFAGDFATTEGDRWLIDDIVDEFLLEGSLVDVLVFDNKRPRPRGVAVSKSRQLRTISVGPASAPQGALAKLSARLKAAGLMHTVAYRILSRETYDVAVFTSVGVVSAGLPRRLRAAGIIKRSIFVLWDFFPIHQIEIGRLPANRLVANLRHMEYFSFANADAVAVMSPANQSFLETYFPKYRGRIAVVPPWAQSDTPRLNAERKATTFTAVFGGQLVKGRGVDTIIRAAALLQDRNVNLRLVIAGDGSLRNELEALAESLQLENLEFTGSIPRPAYRELLGTAHVGIAATVNGVSVPAFPSKIVEYCRASLPVVACLDRATDAGDVLLKFAAGVVVEANNAEMLAEALETLAEDFLSGKLVDMSRSARSLFENELSASHAARTILAAGGL